MATITRTREVSAPIDRVWKVVADPHHLPRWWPRIERIEQVSEGAFTEVLRSERGRVIRADQRLTVLEEPSEVAWEQLLEGTPFERLLREVRTTVRLTSTAAGGTRIELIRVQKMKGMARLGSFLARGAARRLADDALERLASLVE